MSSRGRATNMSTVTRAGVSRRAPRRSPRQRFRPRARRALPAPRAYAATAVPSSRDLHLMRRFSFGFSAALQQQVATAGGARAWFTAQLSPDTVPDTFADGLRGWFPRLETSPRAAYANRAQAGARMEFTRSSARHSMLRQVYSNRQVHEVMVDFWLNHFHVFAQDNHAWPFRPGYDDDHPGPRPGFVRGPAQGRRHPPGDADVPRPGSIDRDATSTRTSDVSSSSCTPSGSAPATRRPRSRTPPASSRASSSTATASSCPTAIATTSTAASPCWASPTPTPSARGVRCSTRTSPTSRVTPPPPAGWPASSRSASCPTTRRPR